MSATGLEVFDKTLQTTHTWLKEIMEELGSDRQVSWHVLGAVLRTVRDRIPVELGAHLSAELPLLVRGLYYDQWRPSAPPERYRSLDEFLDILSFDLNSTRPVDPQDAAMAVFTVLSRHIPVGQVEKVRHALPEDIRALWPSPVSVDVEIEVDEVRFSRDV
jgi:uncharacterized protein (DUF2267 family)